MSETISLNSNNHVSNLKEKFIDTIIKQFLKMIYFQRVILEEIYYLKTFEKKTLMVSTTGQQGFIGMSLSHFEKKNEASKLFVRVNKQYIVNRNFIETIDANKIVMQNGMTFLNTSLLV